MLNRSKYFRRSDRCRTTNNMLGDAYGAAVVEALSRKELEKMDMDDDKEMTERGPDEEALIGIYKSSSTESNGSSVKVREVLEKCLTLMSWYSFQLLYLLYRKFSPTRQTQMKTKQGNKRDQAIYLYVVIWLLPIGCINHPPHTYLTNHRAVSYIIKAVP